MTIDGIVEAPPCLPPHPPGAAPSWRLPDGTCDSHMHVFGPRDRYPLAPLRSYTPHLLTIDDYRAVMAALGIARAVLVQPSVYGMDNRALLDALAIAPDQLRGVVVVPPDIPDGELKAMHRLGVRGIRINRRNPGGLSLSDIATLGRRIGRLGWHIQLQIELATSCDLDGLVRGSPVPIVIDHLGFADPQAGVASPAFRQLLHLLEDGLLWIKLSAPYRMSRTGAPYADMVPIVETLLSARPDRLLWATDWPHTELWSGMPHDGDLLVTSPLWQAPPGIRKAVFVDNPNRLYWA
ncbi:amidohydrolase family protein [Bosea vaviloviae]|uniref:amidohydrolase family protein n=1 Tax=Bosea vaviloviae TaxID=1526658 RepID=UPI0009F51C39|nr:amidohydrolase family protein [Bosea vaviloviae]